MPKVTRILPLLAVAAFAAVAWTQAAAGERNVVVELFTSQGCALCPPADSLLAELSRQENVVALSFHVDYWNYIGWKDPFSSRESTERQRGYGRTLKKRYVYTPQMIVDGKAEVVGARRDNVMDRIAAARKRPKLEITVIHSEDGLANVRIPAGHHSGPPADVWVALYDREHRTKVKAGENSGRNLTNVNVVRVFQRVAGWHGRELNINLPLEALGSKGRDGCAIVVQRKGFGAILGVKAIPLSREAMAAR